MLHSPVVTEHQTIEYKQHWRDEYLKWICGFANAQGGTLFIGMDDAGKVVGVEDYEKLLYEIPNKTAQHLGLVVDVNLHQKAPHHYIEIKVPPSHAPISYHGIFHYRSGSTKQELKGVSLHNWLLKKYGISWEDVPVPGSTVMNVDEQTLKRFIRDALKKGRVSPDVENSDIQSLLRNLRLMTDEGELTRAAILLFGKDTTHRFVTSTFKIGRFGNSPADLINQDIVEGNILYMADKVLDILKTKYLVRPIHYEGLQRVEPLEYPEDALREAILNAIIHKDYSSTYTFLRVYPDKLTLFNPGPLPEGYSIERLRYEHSSLPRNQHIADVFFKAGFIESWGRGISRIIDNSVAAGLPEPIIEGQVDGVHVTFFKDIYREEYLKNFGLEDRQIKALIYMKEYGNMTNIRYQELTDVSKRTATRDLQLLLDRSLIQKVGTTGKGTSYILQRSIPKGATKGPNGL